MEINSPGHTEMLSICVAKGVGFMVMANSSVSRHSSAIAVTMIFPMNGIKLSFGGVVQVGISPLPKPSSPMSRLSFSQENKVLDVLLAKGSSKTDTSGQMVVSGIAVIIGVGFTVIEKIIIPGHSPKSEVTVISPVMGRPVLLGGASHCPICPVLSVGNPIRLSELVQENIAPAGVVVKSGNITISPGHTAVSGS